METLEHVVTRRDPPAVDRYLIRGHLWERPARPRGRSEATCLARAAALVSGWVSRQPWPRGEVLIDFAYLLREEPRTLVDVALSFVPAAAARAIPAKAWWTAARPDLVVEVFNDRESRGAVTERAREYAACGVRELWVIDPTPGDCWVDMVRAGGEPARLSPRQSLASGVLTGFSCPVADLFR